MSFQTLMILPCYFFDMPSLAVQVGDRGDVFDRAAAFELVFERDGAAELPSLRDERDENRKDREQDRVSAGGLLQPLRKPDHALRAKAAMPFIEQDGPFFTGKRQQVQDQRRGRRVFQFDVGKNFRRGRKDDPPRALPIGEPIRA